MGEKFKKVLSWLFIVLFICFIINTNKIGAVIPGKNFYEHIGKLPKEQLELLKLFPIPINLVPNIEFWKTVFTKYDSSKIVIHDVEKPDRIYVVIDSPDPPENLFKPFTQKELDLIDASRQEIQQILKSLSHKTNSSDNPLQKLDPLETSIYKLFPDTEDTKRFKNASLDSRIRAQRGAADNIEEAIAFSGFYISMMQDALIAENIPEELAYLCIIESLFDPMAVSSAGAAGQWQLMFSAAKHEGLTINKIKDDRKDPYISTFAAAKKIVKEKKILTDHAINLGIWNANESLWPLIITAYNFGVYGMKRAMKSQRSTDIEDILFKYKNRRKGFAVKNFYAEFIAVLQIYTNYKEYFPDVTIAQSLDTMTEEKKLTSAVKFADLATELGIENEILHFLNPAFSHLVRYSYISIPKNTIVRVPMDSGAEKLLSKLANHENYIPDEDALLKHNAYKVRSRDTLWDIAKTFNVDVKTLKLFNKRSTSRIYPGEILLIPIP